ncbi:uncharacterized protein LOC134718928 isoform X1 [Mytilus trossulus]|uniref:uncharacterized protein LOC134718928 isoform X1 n=1 Tax=Mytilus trossulus TaxID=6551 RepID=UPI003007A274
MIAMFLIVVVSCLLSFSHEGSVATNTAECYRSEDILDCRDDVKKVFSGEIEGSINRVLMNHIMNSDQIENVRNVKASCVFELSLSSKELCDTVQGKIIVVNGEECSSYDTTIETYSKDVTSTEKMPLGISTIIGVKEIEEEEEGNTTHINGIYYILAVCVIGVLYLLPINPIFREDLIGYLQNIYFLTTGRHLIISRKFKKYCKQFSTYVYYLLNKNQPRRSNRTRNQPDRLTYHH